MTQAERIEKYIKDYGSITPIEAFKDLGITKLATRISEMRRNGYEVDIERVESTRFSLLTSQNTQLGRNNNA